MKVKKVLKIIGIILLILFILLLIHTIRNFIIIKGLQENFNNYRSSNNYHITSVAKETENITVTMNYYKKDNKQVVFMERKTEEENLKLTMYDNGERVDIFTENDKEKTCRLAVDTELMQVNLVNYLETDNDWQTFLGSIFARINKGKLNQKECYIVNNFVSPLFMNDSDKNEVYLEKDTGLYIKSIMGSMVTDREYEFDNVEDSIFTEPDISQYKLLEN